MATYPRSRRSRKTSGNRERVIHTYSDHETFALESAKDLAVFWACELIYFAQVLKQRP